MAAMSEGHLYVSSAVTVERVSAALTTIGLLDGVEYTDVEHYTDWASPNIAVGFYGPDADAREAEYAARLKAELGVAVTTLNARDIPPKQQSA